MNKRERMDWLPFAQRAKSGPDRTLSLKAAFLLNKYGEKRKPMPKRKIEKKQERLAKKGVRADVRAACVERAGGRCECCRTPLEEYGDYVAEMDHFEGRARSESVETCWVLARACHLSKTQNWPSRDFWDDAFARHCARHGYPLPRKRFCKPARLPSRSEPLDRMERSVETAGGRSLSTEVKP